MPASVRGVLNIRRTCRRKIHERITAVSGKYILPQINGSFLLSCAHHIYDYYYY